jgi:transporter family protein
MLWALLVIAAVIMWSITTIFDKYTLSKWFDQSVILTIILSIVGFFAGILIFLLLGFVSLSFINIFLAFVSGSFYVIGMILFFYAVKIEETSRVVPLLYMAAFFTAFFASIFLGEVLTPLKYLGIILLVSGAFLISTKKFRIKHWKTLLIMLTATTVLSLENVILKYLLGYADFWTVFSWEKFGAMLATIPLIMIYYKDLAKSFKRIGKKAVLVSFANKGLSVFATLIYTLAISIGFVSLVTGLASVQPLFVLLFTVLLSMYFPKIIKEEIDRSTIFLKIISIFLIIAGALLIA